MSAVYRKEISLNGYKLPILKSGLQKYIRRGNLYKALYCAAELDLFKNIEGGARIRTNFLNRLRVILLEDVCNISLIEQVIPIDENNIHDIISKMCVSKKARICSHVRALFYAANKKLLVLNGVELNINVSDKHSLTKLIKLYKKYFKQKSILCIKYAIKICSSDEKLDAPYKRSRKPVYSIFKILAENGSNILYENLYKNHIGHLKEGFLCWMVPTLYHIGIIKKEERSLEEYEKINENWRINLEKQKIEIDDFIKDIHTGNCRKNRIDFADEGSLVTNEYSWVNQTWKTIYNQSKYLQEGMEHLIPNYKQQLETQYKFIIRAQLNTSQNKMDVYFAKKNNRIYVIKGPYPKKKNIDTLKLITQIKKDNNIDYVPFKIKRMIPNRWTSVPLGIRNKIDVAKSHYFIIFDSLIENFPNKIHSSKLWPPTQVVDWNSINLHLDWNTRPLSDIEMKYYVDMIIFRYILGISDLADRNFLRQNEKIYSIDEDIMGRNIDLKKALKKNKCEIIKKWIIKNHDILSYKDWHIDKKYIVNNVESKEKLLSLF